MAKAAADLGFDSDDDEEMAPAPRKKKKVKKSPDSKKKVLRQCRWPRDDGVDAAARRRRRVDAHGLSQDRRKEAQEARCSSGHLRVRALPPPSCGAPIEASRRGKQAPPPKSKEEILKNLVRKQKVDRGAALWGRDGPGHEDEVGD